jgi:hypothetical protein
VLVVVVAASSAIATDAKADIAIAAEAITFKVFFITLILNTVFRVPEP